MQPIKGFKLEDVPAHSILFSVTELGDYTGDKLMIAEWPSSYRDFTVIEGGHCSCYGFEEVEWSAITYSEEEIKKVVEGWQEKSYGCEKKVAALMLQYFDEADRYS